MVGKTNAAAKALQKENDCLKTLLAESTLVVDALKNLGGEESLTAVQYLVEHDMSLNKALNACEVSKQKRYWKKKPKKPKMDQSILDMVRAIRERRSFYGTRRVAAELSRQLGRPINRKTIRRLYSLVGWSKSVPPKADAKARWKPIEAVRPNQIWQTYITYVWCGQADGWCYCFNILDVFTLQWITCRFNTLATADVAVVSGRRCCHRQTTALDSPSSATTDPSM